MKIVFLNRYQNKFNRGAENFVLELSSRLSQKHQVDIFSGSDADNLSKVIEGKYDLVVPLNGRLQSLKVSLGRIVSNYKVLITGHSGIGRDDIWNIVVAKPDIFVALTDVMAKWAKNWAWGSKVVKIPNGVDLKRFKPDGEKVDLGLPKPIILSVGALVWYKYHDKVIKAVRALDQGSVLIVGEGPDKEKLMDLGHRLLGDRFKIMRLSYHDMPSVYRSCDLFTLPSWDREAFGLVYLEALSSGLGVVAPNDSSRKEIVGNGGLLANVDKPDEYAQAIKQALQSNWLTKSRDQAEKFSWDKIAQQYEQVMQNMVRVRP